MPLSAARIHISPPQRLTTGALLILHAHGLLLALPVLLAALIVSLQNIDISSFVFPVLAMGMTLWFLPLGLGNPYVSWLVRAHKAAVPTEPAAFIVQIKLRPRLQSGLRAWLEDADDIGVLSFTESKLLFEGDAIRLSVPFEEIQQVCRQSSGWRGLFVYGAPVALEISGLAQVRHLEIAERTSWLLPTSRKIAAALYAQFLQAKATSASAQGNHS